MIIDRDYIELRCKLPVDSYIGIRNNITYHAVRNG